MDRRVARSGRVIRDDIPGGGESDDHEEMSVRSVVVEEARQRARRVRDRGHERNAGGDVPLGVVKRSELEDTRGKTEARRIGSVEGPVPGAAIRRVEREAIRLVDLRVRVRAD